MILFASVSEWFPLTCRPGKNSVQALSGNCSACVRVRVVWLSVTLLPSSQHPSLAIVKAAGLIMKAIIEVMVHTVREFVVWKD